eukprot:364116-Pyramimonas_sp.AAC.1
MLAHAPAALTRRPVPRSAIICSPRAALRAWGPPHFFYSPLLHLPESPVAALSCAPATHPGTPLACFGAP